MIIAMTAQIARAIARDKANQNMKKNGRTAWDEDDYNLACDTLNRLWPDPFAFSAPLPDSPHSAGIAAAASRQSDTPGTARTAE